MRVDVYVYVYVYVYTIGIALLWSKSAVEYNEQKFWNRHLE